MMTNEQTLRLEILEDKMLSELTPTELDRVLHLTAKHLKTNSKKDQTFNTAKIAPNPYGNYRLMGLGPDAKVVTTEQGGKQSATPYAFHAFPPLAIARCAKVLAEGLAKYGLHNWVNIPDPLDHLGKAIGHCMAFLGGDTQESNDPSEHIAHAICRLTFALDLIEREKQQNESF